MADDIIIRGGTVIDGSGAAGVRADVALRDGRIMSVGTDIVDSAATVIEADEKIIAPGFIDIKTHSDWTLPLMPQCESKVRQGVTTEVIGHCGFSCAPALPGKAEALADYLGPSAPWLTFVETSFADYSETYPATSVNRVMLVGHNTLRLMTMGMEDRPPEPAELHHMKTLLEDALVAGAFGMSSGLFTAPGSYSEGEELVELGAILKQRNALYFTHLRDEGNNVYDAVAEATEFGERTGVHVQIVHIKLSGMDNWGGADKLIAQLRNARARGIKIDCDEYPYVAASNPLKNLMPSWLQEGGVNAMLERLGQREVRDRIKAEIDERGLNNFGRIPDWDALRVSISPNQPAEYAGRTLADIARERNADPFETMLDYIIEDRGQSRVLVSSISEDDVRTFVADPDVMVGSDGNSVAPHGITGQGKPHPRFYGTFARVLGLYVRDENLLPIERAIWKMTGAPARALGITDRGRVALGMAADITIFDPETVAEKATYQEPHQYAVGFEHVLINGQPVIAHGEHTGALPGKMLRQN